MLILWNHILNVNLIRIPAIILLKIIQMNSHIIVLCPSHLRNVQDPSIDKSVTIKQVVHSCVNLVELGKSSLKLIARLW